MQQELLQDLVDAGYPGYTGLYAALRDMYPSADAQTIGELFAIHSTVSATEGFLLLLREGLTLPPVIIGGLAVLAKYGSEAHLFIPGVGVVNGIDAQNFLESTFVTPAVVAGPVGGVKGSADAAAVMSVTNIRLNITSNFGSNYVVIGELRVKDNTGAVIDLASATLTASSQYGTWSPDRLKDGGTDQNTQSWSSDGVVGPQWVNISFPAPVKAAVLEIQNANPTALNESARTGDIEVTNSDSTVSYHPYTRASDVADLISLHTIGKLHLTQATTANKPMLGIEPMGGRRNLISNSVFAGAVSGTPGTPPTGWSMLNAAGTLTANGESLTLSASEAREVIGFSYTAAVGDVLTFSLDVDTDSSIGIHQLLVGFGQAGQTQTQKIDGVSATVYQLVPVGFHKLEITVTVTTAGSVSFRLGVGCTGNSTGTATFSKPQLERGGVVTAYQRTLSAYEAYEDGKESIYYWQKGASASWLGGAPLFDGTVRDYYVGVAFVPNVLDSGIRYIFSPAMASGLAMRPVIYSSLSNFRIFDSDGTNHLDASVGALVADTTYVMSGLRLGNTVYPKLNGVARTAVTKTGQSGIAPTQSRIMSDASGTTYPSNGKLYAACAVQASVTADEQTTLDTMLDYISGRVR